METTKFFQNSKVRPRVTIDNFVFSGWPKIKVLALPFKDMYPILIFAFNGFILPILGSCVIYFILILHTKKHLQHSICDDGTIQANIEVNYEHFRTGLFTLIYLLRMLNTIFLNNS